jgi:hypothetical protein
MLDNMKLRDACGLVEKIVAENKIKTKRLTTKFTMWEQVLFSRAGTNPSDDRNTYRRKNSFHNKT